MSFIFVAGSYLSTIILWERYFSCADEIKSTISPNMKLLYEVNALSDKDLQKDSFWNQNENCEVNEFWISYLGWHWIFSNLHVRWNLFPGDFKSNWARFIFSMYLHFLYILNEIIWILNFERRYQVLAIKYLDWLIKTKTICRNMDHSYD